MLSRIGQSSDLQERVCRLFGILKRWGFDDPHRRRDGAAPGQGQGKFTARVCPGFGVLDLRNVLLEFVKLVSLRERPNDFQPGGIDRVAGMVSGCLCHFNRGIELSVGCKRRRHLAQKMFPLPGCLRENRHCDANCLPGFTPCGRRHRDIRKHALANGGRLVEHRLGGFDRPQIVTSLHLGTGDVAKVPVPVGHVTDLHRGLARKFQHATRGRRFSASVVQGLRPGLTGSDSDRNREHCHAQKPAGRHSDLLFRCSHPDILSNPGTDRDLRSTRAGGGVGDVIRIHRATVAMKSPANRPGARAGSG